MNKIIAEIDAVISATEYRDTNHSTYIAIANRFGVKFLGKGVARATFLIDGKAFKFQRNDHTCQSSDERETYKRVKALMESDPKKFFGWGIPEMEFHDMGNGRVVVEAEFIPTDHGINAWDNPFNFYDAHSENVFLYNGIKYIVDLG